jgi:hypothetical protein
MQAFGLGRFGFSGSSAYFSFGGKGLLICSSL